MRVLFVCSRNRLRSPTAEQVFGSEPGLEVCSAGLSPDAEYRLDSELVSWADLIFVMEPQHRVKLTKAFRMASRGKRIVCLDIPDHFDYMDAELIALLRERVTPHLPG